MEKKSNAVKPDIIGFVAASIVKIGRYAFSKIGAESDSHPGRIMLCWKRNDVCVETKERSENITKEYPRLVEKTWKGHNRVFKYRIPTGLKHDKLIKSINDIEFDLKSEVLFKLLENDKKAHFSLTVLSGHLLDIIHYTNEAEKFNKGGLWIPIGWSRRGLEQLDLSSSSSPHLMIGGATGGGKSILGRLILACLHMRYSRDDCRLWLADLKHGNGTSLLGPDPLLVDKTITSPGQVEEMMDELSKIIGERYALFKKYGCDDLQAYNEEYPSDKLPRIVVYVDEMTKLEGKYFRAAREKMTKVTGESRGAGVHVIISCHRPTANLVDGTMKNNFSAVVAFKCNPVSARVLLGDDDWEASKMIDHEIEGRALFRFTDEVLVQVPFINNKMIKEIMASYQKLKNEQSEEVVKVARAPQIQSIKVDEEKNSGGLQSSGKNDKEKPGLKLIKSPRTITGHDGQTKEWVKG